MIYVNQLRKYHTPFPDGYKYLLQNNEYFSKDIEDAFFESIETLLDIVISGNADAGYVNKQILHVAVEQIVNGYIMMPLNLKDAIIDMALEYLLRTSDLFSRYLDISIGTYTLYLLIVKESGITLVINKRV